MAINSKTFLTLVEKIYEWSLYLLILCLPFSNTIVEITITAAFICFMLKKILTRKPLLERTGLNIAFLVFLACLLPSFINTGSIFLSFVAFISKNLKFVLLAIVVADSINDKIKIENLLKIALLAMGITLINAFIQYYVTHYDIIRNHMAFKYYIRVFQRGDLFLIETDIGFPTASFGFPNDFAAWMGIYMLPILAIIGMARVGLKTRLLHALYFIPLCYMFILTKARGAWLGFFSGLVFLLFFRLKKIILVSIIAVFLLYLSFNRLIGYYVVQLTSIDDRVQMWNTGWKIFAQHPLAGSGINTFYEKYKRERTDNYRGELGSYAHNCFLQMAAETGIVGLFGFLYLMIIFFRRTIRRTLALTDNYYKFFNIGLVAAILAFLVHSFFDTNLYSLPLGTFFWFSLGFTQAILSVEEKRRA